MTVVPPDAGLADTTVPGRHSADAPVPVAPAPVVGGSGGRHAARGSSPRSTGRAATRTSRPAPQVTLEPLELPTDGEVSPEQVDELAEQMLAHLAVTETRAEVLDPESLPGGKWGFAAGLMAALVLAFIVVSWVLVHLTNR